MTKKEAIEKFVDKELNSIPTEWIEVIMRGKGEEHRLPMWGTMWLVDSLVAKNLETELENCDEHDEYNDECERCGEVDEEMRGEENIKGTSAYLYEIDGQYIIGINGAGWNFYNGVWDVIYDMIELKWHKSEDLTQKTLGELLSDNNEIVKRNAGSILKQLQKSK